MILSMHCATSCLPFGCVQKIIDFQTYIHDNKGYTTSQSQIVPFVSPIKF